MRYRAGMNDPNGVRAKLRAATADYDTTAHAHETARETAQAAVVDALRAGVSPTEVEKLSPFTGTYIRKLARDSGIPPAAPGVKPGGKRKGRG